MKPSNAIASARLLGTDAQQSVLQALAPLAHHQAYSPYGYCPDLHSALAFNGERPDGLTGHYHLGNGYRAFNPVLMRFNSPDSESPFSEAGINSYSYCGGDPINKRDDNGHISSFRSFTQRPWRTPKYFHRSIKPTPNQPLTLQGLAADKLSEAPWKQGYRAGVLPRQRYEALVPNRLFNADEALDVAMRRPVADLVTDPVEQLEKMMRHNLDLHDAATGDASRKYGMREVLMWRGRSNNPDIQPPINPASAIANAKYNGRRVFSSATTVDEIRRGSPR